MNGHLRRLGCWCASRPRRVVTAWLLAVVAATVLSATVGGAYRDDMVAPGTSSAAAAEQVRVHVPDAMYARAHVVARWDAAPDGTLLQEVRGRVVALPSVADVREEHSSDGSTVLLAVTYDAELPDLDARTLTRHLTDAAAPLERSAAEVAVGGQVPESVQGPNGVAEAVGVAVAALVLLLAFGSVVAAGLPLLVAAGGLGVGLALVSLLARVTDVSSVSPTLGSMIGLGVGIDYALLVVARQRAGLGSGLDPVTAAGAAIATAGRSVLVAAGCVLVGLTGLAWSGVPGFAWMGVAAGTVAVVTATAAVTLLPALLGLAGDRVLRRRGRTVPGLDDGDPTGGRVVAAVVRHPVAATVITTGVLLLLATPAASMRLGQNDAGSEPVGTPTRAAYDLVAEGFGPGANGPLTVVVDTAVLDAQPLAAALAAQPGVASVRPPAASPDGALALLTVLPDAGPQTEGTEDLVRRLQQDVLPAGAELTGPTASLLDTTGVLGDNLGRVVVSVLAVTAVLLVPLMRSVVLPVKAVLVALLSSGASLGVLTLLFQTGAGAVLIGLSQPVPIAAWAPMVLFAVLFGLSMDYEVFLVDAVREQHERGAGPVGSVVRGLGATSRVITSAGAIMVAVAFGFALDPAVMVKLIGVGLAVAIVLDVTLVRMVLVPAVMVLTSRVNWWLPAMPSMRKPPPGRWRRTPSQVR